MANTIHGKVINKRAKADNIKMYEIDFKRELKEEENRNEQKKNCRFKNNKRKITTTQY